MGNTTFIFIRHAESMKNLKEITGGSGEILTEFGIKQANILADTLCRQIDTENCEVITSDMIQAEQTAKIIANKLRVPFYISRELWPADMGIVSGLTQKEIQQNYPAIYEQLSLWRDRKLEACALTIPNMEPPAMFWERILNYLKSLCTGGVKIIVCTRSVLVLIVNYIHMNSPKPGGKYKHVHINNCETIAFKLDANGTLVKILYELTSSGLIQDG